MLNRSSSEKIYQMPFSRVYLLYIEKVSKKGYSKVEVDQIIIWLTGYTLKSLNSQINRNVDLQQFFDEAPKINPKAHLITGVICGIRVEEIEEPLMKNIRYLDKLIDELAKGKSLSKIFRE